jgi:hypothetical protein
MIVDHIIWEATVPSQSYNNENFASAGTGENTEKHVPLTLGSAASESTPSSWRLCAGGRGAGGGGRGAGAGAVLGPAG